MTFPDLLIAAEPTGYLRGSANATVMSETTKRSVTIFSKGRLVLKLGIEKVARANARVMAPIRTESKAEIARANSAIR
ncbi:MAG: hypothetical protein EB045_01775 [Actinobacteria bacterium]|nr:hypothetical protein [Actinomycetota bacterium]